MRKLPPICLVLLTLFVLTAAPHAQQAPPATSATVSLDAVLDRVTKAESTLTAKMATYKPVVEVYLQNLIAQDPALGAAPTRDDYFLGQFEGKGNNERPGLAALNGA